MTSTTGTAPDHLVDPRPAIDRALATTATVIAAVRPDQLGNPTPCSEMDVRTMLGHLVGVLGRITALGRGDDPFAVVETSASDDGWTDAWATAAERAADAWADDAALDRPIALPWIQGSGAEVLATYLGELTVHTWDLATATGQRPDWDEVVVAGALAAPPILPAEGRLAMFEEISAAMGLTEVAVPFAEVVAVPADAPAIDRLVAWYGRNPSLAPDRSPV